MKTLPLMEKFKAEELFMESNNALGSSDSVCSVIILMGKKTDNISSNYCG
jgi:hypothetical protein